MVVVSGLGWVTLHAFGSVFRKLQGTFSDRKELVNQLVQHQVFHQPLPPLGRYDQVSRVTCYAVGLCLADASTIDNTDPAREIGIMGANETGCLQSNVDYFQDFVSSGRNLGRGNLFVYTLPSSPVAASSIYFGLTGPVFYLSFPQHRLAGLLRAAQHIVASGESEALVAVDASETQGIAFLLNRVGPKSHPSVEMNATRIIEQIEKHPIPDAFDGFLEAVTKLP